MSDEPVASFCRIEELVAQVDVIRMCAGGTGARLLSVLEREEGS